MNCLLVPTLAYDLSLLDRLAKSIDYPIRHKVVINNGRKEWIGQWQDDHPDWEVINLPENIGVAASWNLAPKLWPFEDTWLIVNDDVQFHPGTLQEICEAADTHKHFPIIHVNEHSAYDVFVWTRVGVDKVGTFDENFYPAYFEDYEYRMRLEAIGEAPHHMPGHITPKHGRTRPGGPNYMAMLAKCKPVNEQYLKEKWGGIEERRFGYPWDVPTIQRDHWSIDYERRATLKKFWDEFWNNTPSVYE